MSEKINENLINISEEEPHQESEYSLDDLEKAKKDLEHWESLWSNDAGNNPNKYFSEIRDARRRIRHISEYLKNEGLLEKSPGEKLNEELDEAYPYAKHGHIVEHENKKYKLSYFPIETSRSHKTVNEWGHKWELLDNNAEVTLPKLNKDRDTPIGEKGIDLGESPLTSKAYKYLTKKGISLKYFPDLNYHFRYLALKNKKQLTSEDIKLEWGSFESLINEEKNQQNLAQEIPKGWNKNNIASFRVCFSLPKSLKIKAILDNGCVVTLESIYFQNDAFTIPEKIDFTNEFLNDFIGEEIEYGKRETKKYSLTIDGERIPDGSRYYFTSNYRKLPDDIKNLSYMKIKNWHKKKN